MWVLIFKEHIGLRRVIFFLCKRQKKKKKKEKKKKGGKSREKYNTFIYQPLDKTKRF